MPSRCLTTLRAPSAPITYRALTTSAHPIVASAHSELQPAGSLPDVLDRDSELDARGRKTSQLVEQHSLEVILRYCRRPGGAETGTLASRRVADLDHGAGGGLGQRRCCKHAPLHLIAARPDLLLQAPGPKQLHRSEAHHSRSRVRKDGGPAVEHQNPDSGLRERDCGNKSGWACANDNDGPNVALIRARES